MKILGDKKDSHISRSNKVLILQKKNEVRTTKFIYIKKNHSSHNFK